MDRYIVTILFMDGGRDHTTGTMDQCLSWVRGVTDGRPAGSISIDHVIAETTEAELRAAFRG